MATTDNLNLLRIEMHEGSASIRAEMRDIHSEIREIHIRLDAIGVELKEHHGFAEEIRNLLQRVAAIEKHLGMEQKK